MRRYAVFCLTTLLLVMPALAHAWTLSVRVNGGSASLGNTVTATGGAVRTITGGTQYLYPTEATTLTVNKPNGYTASYRINGESAINIAAETVTPTVLPTFTAGGSLEVTYTAPALAGFTIQQASGGTIRAELPNNTTTTSSPDGLAPGSRLNLLITANAGYQIDSYTIGGVTTPVGGGVSSTTVGYTVSAGQVVTALFSQTMASRQDTLSARILAPLAGYTNSSVRCSAIANGATGFAFSLIAKPLGSHNTESSSSSFFAFTPDTAGTYTVQLVVTGNGTTVTKTADVVVASKVAYDNSQCTSCHSTQPQSAHSYGGLVSSCTGCHTTAPHSAGNASTHATQTTCTGCHHSEDTVFQASLHYTKPSDKLTCGSCHTQGPLQSFNSAACESCHAGGLSTTTHPAELTSSRCLNCHDGHNPAKDIVALNKSTNHPAVTLYTFEEIAMQTNGGQPVPVQVDSNGKGMPYSPKQTCGTANCHIKNGVDYTYDKITDHAFHSAQGRNEYVDSSTGKFDATKNKPWLQSTAMVGKW